MQKTMNHFNPNDPLGNELPVEGIVILFQPRSHHQRGKIMNMCADIIVMSQRYLLSMFAPYYRTRWLEEEEVAELMKHDHEKNQA